MSASPFGWRPWVLLGGAVAAAGATLVYLIGTFWFPTGTLSGLFLKAAAAGGVAGAAFGVLCGLVAERDEILKQVAFVSAPTFGFGGLLLPRLIDGHWTGIALWWVAAAATFAAGLSVCWCVRYVVRLFRRPTRNR